MPESRQPFNFLILSCNVEMTNERGIFLVELTKHTNHITGCKTYCWAEVQDLFKVRVHAQYTGKHVLLATPD